MVKRKKKKKAFQMLQTPSGKEKLACKLDDAGILESDTGSSILEVLWD